MGLILRLSHREDYSMHRVIVNAVDSEVVTESKAYS